MLKRVAEYSRLLAVHYGLPEAESDLLKLASPLHDIGKIAIPDRILLKPGKLDKEEWITMQTHVILGYDMLKHSERQIIKAAAIVAREHHEKWNGTGYPDQKRDTEIHIFGRITALADVFDALGSDPCYKNAWKLERILKLFGEERGKHFEPGLVDAFLDNRDDFLQIRSMYQDGAYEE